MKNFATDSTGYLLKFARATKGQPFCSEDVTTAATAAGIVSNDVRNWGAVFRRAARDGYIARCDTPFRRMHGNGTLTLGWVAI